MKKIHFIVVHTTGTPPGILPRLYPPRWHYLIRRTGEVQLLMDERTPTPYDKKKAPSAIHIALQGGLDKQGNTCNTITKMQEDALFDTIVSITEHHPEARAVGADLWDSEQRGPGFDVPGWLKGYTPELETLIPVA